MAQVLTPHTVCLVRLLTYQEESGVLMTLRFKKTLVEEVVTFVIGEIQCQECYCGDLDCVRRYFSLAHFKRHLADHVQSRRIVDCFDTDVGKLTPDEPVGRLGRSS